MQLSNIPGKLVLPFATGGGKNTIPTASQIGITAGAASLTDGFPPLTRTPIAAGGVPPSGLDMNGILYELSAILRWANAGGGYAYDSAFANDTNVNGYPKGARIMRTDGLGYWFNTVENNVTDPESAGAAAAGWVPDYTSGITTVAMTGSSVTLTPLQYGKPIILLTGTLTANLNLIFPAISGEWVVVNNTAGAFTVSAKTPTGAAVLLPHGSAGAIVSDGTTIYSTYQAANVMAYGATGDGTTFDDAALNAAVTGLSADGGPLFMKSGVYRLKRSMKLTKRQIQFVGQSYHNTYLKLDLVGVDRGSWAGATSYAVDDVVTVADSNGTAVPYVCNTAHTSGTFATDLAAGKWEMWCCLSVEASDCSWEGIFFDVPNKGVGAAVQGAARANPRRASYTPRTNASGYGILLSDSNPLGAFSPGSYTHTIGPGNLVAVFTQGVRQFAKGLVCTGSNGGINATRFVQNHFVGDACVDIPWGGGNSANGNLLQSFTGGNSGSRPYTGGIGYGFKFGGALDCNGNYFERFLNDLFPSSSSAKFSSVGHHSDASNNYWPLQSGYPVPGTFSGSEGVASEVYDGMTFYGSSMTGNGFAIQPNARFLNVNGNGANRSGCTISNTGAMQGQRLTLYANTWAFELITGGALDLTISGGRLVLGQKGQSVGAYKTQGTVAEFVYGDANAWVLISHNWHSAEPGSAADYAFSGNGETMTAIANTVMITGGGAARTGALLSAGDRIGQQLTITANSWAVTFAAGAASWGTAGAPTFGNASGQVLAMDLVYTASGWFERCRTVRP